ncbi:MAG: NAD(P)/FAD-dependent oxidoreductase [Pirellulales bacterium]
MQEKSKQAHWVVAGGGMLGLATALKLIERGEKVTLLESAKELGGLTSAWKLGDVTWDRFYHVTLLSDTKLRALLEKLDLEKEIEWVQTRTGFYSDGKLHSMSNTLEFLTFPVLNFYQKLRLGGTIFLGSKIKNWRAMERLSVESWLRRWSGSSTYQKIWLPLLKAKLGEAYQRASAAFIWSYIDRMYKARRSGMKREMFGYVPGGYQRILAKMQQTLVERGCRILCDANIQKIEAREGQGLEVTFGPSDHPKRETFDRAILTIPSHTISTVCPQLEQDEHQRLQSVEYIGVVCTSLLLEQPLGGYYVTNITDSWVPLTGIIEMGAIVKPDKLDGHYLVYLPRYLMSDDTRLSESEDSIHERCLQTLEKMYPQFRRDQVKAIQTARAKYVMALPTLNYSETRPKIVSSMPGVYLLNSAQIVKGNLNVNETLELLDDEMEQTVWRDHQRLG